jgi:hypothetical protein
MGVFLTTSRPAVNVNHARKTSTGGRVKSPNHAEANVSCDSDNRG